MTSFQNSAFSKVWSLQMEMWSIYVLSLYIVCLVWCCKKVKVKLRKTRIWPVLTAFYKWSFILFIFTVLLHVPQSKFLWCHVFFTNVELIHWLWKISIHLFDHEFFNKIMSSLSSMFYLKVIDKKKNTCTFKIHKLLKVII